MFYFSSTLEHMGTSFSSYSVMLFEIIQLGLIIVFKWISCQFVSLSFWTLLFTWAVNLGNNGPQFMKHLLCDLQVTELPKCVPEQYHYSCTWASGDLVTKLNNSHLSSIGKTFDEITPILNYIFSYAF